MLRAERESLMLLAFEPASAHHRRSVCLTGDKTEPGQVLRLVEDPESIRIRAGASLSLQTFETCVYQGRRSRQELQIEIQDHSPRRLRRRLTVGMTGRERAQRGGNPTASEAMQLGAPVDAFVRGQVHSDPLQLAID